MRNALLQLLMIMGVIACGDSESSKLPTPAPKKVEVVNPPTPKLHFSGVFNPATFAEIDTLCTTLKNQSLLPFRLPNREELLSYLPTIKDGIPLQGSSYFWTSIEDSPDKEHVVNPDGIEISLKKDQKAYGICLFEEKENSK